ncbi:MAG TPA: thiamine phosphate synthase [Hyphomicrobiaceae bacterium]|nr:thiamine phosphate synthase [Hyphomicrobiaceae bacterium]
MTEPPTGCRLYAVIEADAGAGERLAAVLAAAEIAAVLIAPAPGQPLEAALARPLIEQARTAGATALIWNDAALARAVSADGVHLAAHDEPRAPYDAARGVAGRDAVVGAEAGISRHAAMLLAEAGADYVGFGAPPHLKDRDKGRLRRQELVSWWSPLFEVPCVAFDVETPAEAADLAAAGADLIAVTLASGVSPAAAASLVESLHQAIQTHTSSSP